jgi:hypothetical protein
MIRSHLQIMNWGAVKVRHINIVTRHTRHDVRSIRQFKVETLCVTQPQSWRGIGL